MKSSLVNTYDVIIINWSFGAGCLSSTLLTISWFCLQLCWFWFILLQSICRNIFWFGFLLRQSRYIFNVNVFRYSYTTGSSYLFRCMIIFSVVAVWSCQKWDLAQELLVGCLVGWMPSLSSLIDLPGITIGLVPQSCRPTHSGTV